jgi:hypothetical protein
MEKNGLYARLYTMQFRNPEEELTASFAQAQKSLRKPGPGQSASAGQERAGYISAQPSAAD